jgi:beta-galactosidase
MKRILLLALLPLWVAGQVKTPPAPRYHLLLDQSWKFYQGDTSLASTTTFNDKTWRSVDLPHDWSIEGPFAHDAPTGGGGGYLPTGIGWYRKTFALPSSARGKQVSIQFDGVYMNSEVWINGHSLGKRPNGYISFVYDLTPFLKRGSNTIAVRVDNSNQPNSRWYSGSGIYRNVWLNITPPLHIAQWGTYITTPVIGPDSSVVSIKTTVDNAGTDMTGTSLETTITDENGREVAEGRLPLTAASKEIPQQLSVKSPLLWSIDQPHLYTVHSSLMTGDKVIDTYTTPFGFRKLEYSATKGFLLNGQRVKINGVCLHHDGGAVGAAVPLEIWEERLTLLKAMGCNAIRTSHNPPAPEFLDLCDQMGFLVMDEAFDVWESGKVKNDYHLYFDDWWQRDVTDQIHRDRNHPSVVLWSAGNEIPDQKTDRGVDLLKGLLALYHEEDPTRPVTTANDDIAADNGATKLAFMETEDIVGYNYVDRWHERRELFYGPDHQDHPAWKMIGTESESMRSVPLYSLGNDPKTVKPNYTGGLVRAEQLWKFVSVHDYVIGDFMWTGIDYLGEARWPGKGSFSGVIDRINLPKDAYYFYQSQWTSKPVLHLLPDWNWAGREGQVIPVIAFTNCDTVELFVNGKSFGIKTQEFPRQGNSGAWNTYDRPFINGTTADLHLSWDVPYEPGVVKAIGHKNGKLVAVDSIQTTGKPVSLRITVDTSYASAGGRTGGRQQKVALLHVDVIDAAGRVVPSADNVLIFSLSGDARLLATDNGNERDDHRFAAAQCAAFNGHAFAVIQYGPSGEVGLTVTSDGLNAVAVDLKLH